MSKNLNKILSKEDISSVSVNMMAAWIAGKAANVVANSVFHYDLNHYNFIDHLVIGTGIGTFAYRKAGGGLRGLGVGLIAGTLFSTLWEPFENKYVFKGSILNLDTLSDVAAVYAGNIIGFLGEKIKKQKKNNLSQ